MHPVRARADGIGNVLFDYQADAGHDQNAKDPKIPRDQECDEIAKADFGPLIKSAFERSEAVEVDNHGRQRQIESRDRDQPKGHLRSAERCRKAYPNCAEDENYLREDKVAQAKFFLERSAARFNFTLDGGKI